MTDKDFRKHEQLEQVFLLHLLSNYQRACTEDECLPRPDHFAHFLVDHQLISLESLRHYAIIHEFEASTATQKYRNKTQTIEALAERFGVHQNTIWNVLKDHKDKFTPRRRQVPQGRS